MELKLVIACFAIVLSIAVSLVFVLWKEWRRTRVLFNVGLRLNSTIKRNDLLQIIMETAAKTMNAEGTSIILVDEEEDELYFEVAVGDKNEEIKEIRLKLGEGVAGWVAKTGQSVLIADAAKDPRWSSRVSTKVNVPTRNMLCVPVVSSGKILGVLQVINRKGSRAFSKRDLKLLEMVASPTAIALENMFLYEALLESMETLKVTTAAKERMESELKIARSIQQSFLPGTDLNLREIDLHARLFPAREVGGDFYHYIPLEEDKLLICLGDVSDKGMPSALFMSGLMIWIQAKASTLRTPSQMLSEINREVSSEESTMFATIFLAVLDMTTGEMLYCNGGHCPPYIIRDSELIELQSGMQLPIGIFADETYEDQRISLESEDILVLYTDGITEAENPIGEMFAASRLKQVLSQTSGRNSQEVTELLRNEVNRFAGESAQSDDIAIMAVKFNTKMVANYSS